VLACATTAPIAIGKRSCASIATRRSRAICVNSAASTAGFPGIEASQCRACHSEHLGREADIVKLSHEQFNHENTDYPMRGAHAVVVCESCHAAGKRYRDAPKECIACHRKEEPHEGKLGRDCGSCHDAGAWRHVKYDHDKTAFPLRDKHLEAPCAACHFGNRYKDTPKECVSCHEPDDVHHGDRGVKCAECHITKGWKNSKFDHKKETGFALEGVHDRIACNDCHRTGNLKDKLPRECFGCHQAQDAHALRLGKDCGTCHGNEKWKPSDFDHTRDTKWPLVGRHEKVACHTCHTASVATQKAAQPTAWAAIGRTTCTPVISARNAMTATSRRGGAPA